MVLNEKNILSKVESEFLNEKKSHQKLNVLNYNEVMKELKLEFSPSETITINKIKYSIETEKNSKIKMIHLGDYKILLRDTVEERFIKYYIETEYPKKRETDKQTLVEFYENSNFAIVEGREYQTLDFIGKDLIEKVEKTQNKK